MIFSITSRLALGLAALSAPAGAVAAQAPNYTEDSGAALSRHVRTLAGSPNNVAALKGAAEAALALGDPQAALTFLGRAEMAAPRDGGVKAAMGSVFLQMEQPAAALVFFGEATSYGANEAGFAGDRGLAHDLTGNTARAQADYQLALRSREDDEIRRRLALSLAIGGSWEQALVMLDPQLRRQDRAAWRARAFVLALAGDSAAATEAVRAVLPQQASAMQPFLVRLPSLGAADRAMAVHFGRFPGDAPPAQIADAGPAPRYAGVDPATIAAGRPDSGQAALGRRNPPPEPVSTAPRRRPGTETAAPERATTTFPLIRRNPAPKPIPIAKAAPALVPAETPKPAPFGPPTASKPILVATAEPAPVAAEAPKPAPFGPPTQPSRRALADMATMLQSLSDPAAAEAGTSKPAPKPVAKVGKPADKPAGKLPPKKKAEPAAPKAASRIWVQIAGGANKAGLPKEFARQKAKAAKLLGSRTAYTTPLRATNRLLVGPFKTEKEAQAFVNDLSKAGLGGFSWTSPAGQDIEKLPAK